MGKRRIKITPSHDGTFIAESDGAQDPRMLAPTQQPSPVPSDAGAAPSPMAPAAVPGVPPIPVAPWNPFAPRPNDDEPAVAAVWLRKLSKVISSVKYMQMPAEWRAILDEKYFSVRQALTPPPMPAEQPGKPKGMSDGTPPKPPAPSQPQMR